MLRILLRLPFHLYASSYLILVTLAYTVAHAAPAEDEPLLLANMFDTTLIRGDGNVELNGLLASSGSAILPGHYVFDVQINNDRIGKRSIELIKQGSPSKVIPCITADLLYELELKPASIESLVAASTSTCLDLALLDTQAQATYDSNQMLLQVSIPQSYMQIGKRGYVDPSLWDYGVNAAFVNYRANMRRDSYYGTSKNSYYLGLTNGLNLGGWRLRNESNLSKASTGSTQFRSNRTYLQHDVTALQSQFSVGELYSNSTIFDSVRFRGIQLSSDEGMWADSERGYTPVVRGIAETNATVEVRQNGYLITSVTVPPGPFTLSDLTPSGSNGDLEITIIEADGRKRSFIQAYASLPLMVKRGILRYSVELGRYKSSDRSLPSPNFGSFSATYGLTDTLTIAGGVQAASNFQALNMGLGTNTPIGAVSLDLTHSRSTVAGHTNSGQSLRALYTKTLTKTNTTFTLAAYRYSTSGYRNFDNHVYEARRYTSNAYAQSRAGYLPRSRMDVTLSQQLGNTGQYGSLYLNANYENYWNQQRANSISAGYGHSWGKVAYNINYSRSTSRAPNSASYNHNQLMLTVSIPLGTEQYSPRLYASSVRSKEGTSTTANLTGYVPGTQYTNYSLQAARSQQGDNSAAISLHSNLPMASIGANYSTGKNYHSYGMNAAGAVVAHAGGVNLTREVGDSFALVEIEGVQGIGLGNNLPTSGRNSYVIYPHAQPYKVNTVRLDASTLHADTELDTMIQTIIPRRGAIVHTSFSGYSGRRVQMRFNWAGGQLPLGASVTDHTDRQVGLVDNNGQALLLLNQNGGTLKIAWQEGQCEVNYQLPEPDPTRYYEKMTETCL